jgi:transcriptional regulator with XRE-family HTH domain
MAERINKSELAKRLGKTAPYISKLVKQKKLNFDKDGLIDYEKALNQLNQTAERITSSRLSAESEEEAGENQSDLITYKTELEKWKAKREQLKYEEEQKMLIPVEAVREDGYSAGNLLKEQFLSMPERLCNIFAAESDAMVIREQWIKETKRILNEVADKLQELK